MSEINLLSNIYWRKKLKDKELVVPLKDDFQFIKTDLLKDNLNGFIKVSRDNPLSKLAIVSSVFSFLLKKYFRNYQDILTLYPSKFINLGNPIFLEFAENESTTFKESLQHLATEIKDVFRHCNYDTNQLKLESFSNFSIQFGESIVNTDDISLLYEEDKEKITLNIFYRTSYLPFLIDSLLTNLRKILSDYDRLINTGFNSLSLLDEIEKRKLFVDFNDTETDYPRDKTIVDLFEEQVKKTPNNVAVVFENKELTYSDLNKQVNQFARYIKGKYSIKQQQVIATLLPKSIDLLVSFLAIEKLGCIYLPIDINYPKVRIDYIIQDSQPEIIITEKNIVQKLSIKRSYILVNSLDLNSYLVDDIGTFLQYHDLAYLIYTSGSTGVPKGVLVEHHSSINMSLDQIRKFEINAKDNVVWFASVAFDASISEIMMSLYSSATLCIPTEEEQKNKDLFISFLKETKSNIITFPPSYLELLNINDLGGLKTIITAGESANPQKAKTIVNRGINYFNAYGPTEYSVCTSIFKLENLEDNKFYKTLPIGRPISNTRVYILDDELRPVPIGVVGKLYVVGVGLARGYLNKPELTSEKFIPNPFEAGARMYDTGDLARWLPDGNIEFLGRNDFQVKIRGYRIELGEIEAHLSQYSENIKQPVAEAKEVNGEKVLVAYYTMDKGSTIDKVELRQYLQSKLPEYMVPGFFVELDTIPLTPNGKIDRKSLPGVTEEDIIRKAYVAPRNEMEQKLVEIWQAVLEIDKVGITDNFFELGGHSLMVAQVLNRMYQQLSQNITFKDFFAEPTIVGISSKLKKETYLPILQAPEQEYYPSTPSQQRLWVLSQLEGGSQAYNMPAVVSLKGRLDEEKFEKAFQVLIAKHEILRTFFKVNAQSGEVRQYILPKKEVRFKIETLDFIDRNKKDIEEYLYKINDESFDLERAPLVRASLLQTKQDEHIFFLSTHHIIGDGWSIEILISEIVETYNLLCEGKEPDENPLRIQYKDYAVWLQDEIKGTKYKKSEDYWLKQFVGEIPVLELPSYKTRPLIQTYNGNNISHLFSESFTDKLKAFSEKQDSTLFMTLMAGIKALLYRYTNQHDIIIGTPIAGREHPDLENQIGLYLNTLAIRTQLEERNTIKSLLKKEKEVLLGAYEHQLYPFDELVGRLNIKRDTSRSALFDVLVVFQNQNSLRLGSKTEDISGLKVEGYDFHRKTSQFDVSYMFVEEGNRLGLTIEYNTDIYDEFLISRMFVHFENLLSKTMDNEDGNIENIDFLAEAERHQLLIDFNDTKVDYPKDKTIVDLFEEQVQKTPDNVAVVFEEQELTYKELNEQSNQLGDYLRQNYHIQPDDLVAIKLDRSEKMIVAILGILKSGAAYVPLDPEYPQERIAYIEQDTKAKVLIDEDFFIEFEKEKYSKFNLTKINTPENLAYIIYTSGTTGQPKGVMIQINSVVNYVESFTNYFEITSQDSILNLSTIAFDTSIEEIFPILLQGGKLCVVKNNKNFDTLLEICIDKSITRLSTNPYIIEYLNSIHSDVTGSLKLKTIISGGDKLNFNQINNLSSTVELYNTYGPTESTVCISYYHIDKEKTKILIGRPISNTQVYILDEALRPVPIGVSGKLYVSGVGLAQGYLNKPELTSEKFISNPFEKGTRMYDTGDLVRWLPDGNIEFLGRNDFQVKIRGYRIELGEIETHLSQYSDAIKQVVTYAKDVNGEKVLVAYYTIDKGSTIDKTALRQYLQSKLPEYMVPGFFVELESIPLTPNGKIDRKSLPEVTGEDIIRKEYVAPRNETEQKLVEIWQEVLGVEKVGITDNFFELGGHSLMVAQVLNRMYQQLSQNVTFKEFFAVPTIVGISKKLQIEEYFPIPKALDQDSYPLTASQQRLWVLSQLEGGSQAYNMPVVVFLEGILDKVNLDKAFRFLIEKHEILRTSFKVDTQSGEVRQYILPQEEVIFNIDILDFSSKDEQAIDNYLQSINSESFNLEKAPLLRTSLMQIEKDKYLFFLSMHHIVGDGWSIEILISEIVDTYNLLCSGKEPDENPLRIQYKDYTIWLQKEIINERYKKAETYWLQQFEEKLPSLELPNYKTRPLVQTYNGDNVSWQFSESFTKRLKTFSKKHDSTLFMTLMVGIKALLYKYTGQHDIIVGIPIAGREHPDLENQIGLYLNTLAIRNRFEEQNSFKSLLEKEKKLLSEAYEHQRYPFDDLVGKLNLRRNAGRSAVFDIFVILQNQNSLYLGSKIKDVIGLKVKEYDFRRKTSQFDVSYMFVEEGNQLKLMIEYNTNIYDEFLISRMFAHFENLLSKAMDNEDDNIENIDFLTEAERHQLLIDFNDTKVDYPKDKTIIDLFEEQVQKTPDNVAVVFEEQELTYKELNEQANQLGDYLRQNYHIQPDDLIAIKLDRSEKMIVAILGILKSGAAYVPMDPEYPQERIAYIEQDTKAKALIDEDFLIKFEKEKEKYSKVNLPKINSPENLAYIIYTSGTTGQPKGVMIENKSVINVIEALKEAYDFEGHSKITAFTSYTFDVSVSEFFTSLLRGGELHLIGNSLKTDAVALGQYLLNNKIEYTYLPPVILSNLPDYDYSTLRAILYAGEPCTATTGKYWSAKKRLYNYYGPTESTIYVTGKQIVDGDVHLIGCPISNTQAYILDEELRLVPIGVAGKLYVAGTGLARGYLNKPELTYEKFITNPFEEGTKMYDTGDLAKWLPNGNIEFLGRNDFQIKIRGYRIELGEIEIHLSQYSDSIKQVVAEVKEVNGEKVLVAYYTINQGGTIDKTALRQYLQSKLPEYMVPGFFVEMESIPLTPNGKIDRKSLPGITGEDIIRKAYVAPRNETEQKLTEIWQEVLGIEKVGITDNFFELGGHSLIGIKMVHRINEYFQIQINVNQIFEMLTIKQLGELINTIILTKNLSSSIDDEIETESFII